MGLEAQVLMEVAAVVEVAAPTRLLNLQLSPVVVVATVIRTQV